MRRSRALTWQRPAAGCLLLMLANAIMLPAALAEDATPDDAASSAENTAVEQPAESAMQEEDWDWDWEEPTTGPAYKSSVTSTVEQAADTAQAPERVGETAEPDFSVSPKSGHVLFADAPDFGVIPSKKDTSMHPCANCHTWAVSNPTPRTLKVPHENFLLQHGLHGKGQFWCFTCHHLEDDGGLKTLEGEKLGFDEAYILCAQCHPAVAKDWSFGAHGKRVENWKGSRRVLNCTACHYQHSPAIKPREAVPPPPIRRGLVRNDHKPHSEETLWDQIDKRSRQSNTAGNP
jgi:hypothetical protein